MVKQNKAYKFRLYPTGEQSLIIRKTFGCVRFVYNKMLAERKETYEKLRNDKEALELAKQPTPANYKTEYEWIKEVTPLASDNAQLTIDEQEHTVVKGQKR